MNQNQKMKMQSIQSMTNSVKKFIFTVSAFVALTVIYLLFEVDKSVFWAIYSFCLKDAFIISLCLLYLGKHWIADLLAIGVSCYLVVPTLVRIYCAFYSKMDYIAYRNVLEKSEYSYFLLLVLTFIAILIYYACKNERKARRTDTVEH